MIQKDDNLIQSVQGYMVGAFGFIVAHITQIDSIAQHIALLCGMAVVVTQLVINLKTLMTKK